jgi:hypothetical protein
MAGRPVRLRLLLAVAIWLLLITLARLVELIA